MPRPYPAEIKMEALRRLRNGERPHDVATSMGIHPRTVRGWRSQSTAPAIELSLLGARSATIEITMSL